MRQACRCGPTTAPDRSLESWLDGHRRFFRRECERIGIAFSERLEVVFERFSIVWPPELADLQAFGGTAT